MRSPLLAAVPSHNQEIQLRIMLERQVFEPAGKGELRLMNDDGIKHAAVLYLRDYGTKAGREAARNINYLRSTGDESAARDWERVFAEIQFQTKQEFHSRWDAGERDS